MTMARQGSKKMLNAMARIVGCLFLTIVVLHFVTVVSSIASGEFQQTDVKHVFSERHMATEFRITIAGDRPQSELAAAKAFARAKELDEKLSDYKADSELMLLCGKAGGGPVQVSDDLLRVLKVGQKIAKESDGAFDVTIGPLVRLWRRARRTREL